MLIVGKYVQDESRVNQIHQAKYRTVSMHVISSICPITTINMTWTLVLREDVVD